MFFAFSGKVAAIKTRVAPLEVSPEIEMEMEMEMEEMEMETETETEVVEVKGDDHWSINDAPKADM